MRERIALMPGLPAPLFFGILLVIASLGFKIAAVPFHAWAPDVYQGAPMPVTSFLATGSKIAGVAALLRLLSGAFSPAAEQLSPVFAVMAVLTLLVGNLGALGQTNIKRLMAYSSVSHAGYLLIGLAAFGGYGGQAVLTYLFGYVAATGGVFLVLIACQPILVRNEIGDLAGLAKRSPVLASGMFLALLSLAGVPPLAGFFAKFYLLWAGVEDGYLWLVALGTISVILSLYFYLRVVKAMYLDEPVHGAIALNVTASTKAMQYAAMIATLVLGVWPAPVVDLAARAFALLK
jgi:NADH-quinone oxidoreductase subunit N